MKKTALAAAAACAAIVAPPASATTFPSLTTIYVIAGVKDSGEGNIERSTHGTLPYTDESALIPGTALSAGVVNIESLESGVFCTAAIIDASSAFPLGVSPHIVRVNPHPGTVE